MGRYAYANQPRIALWNLTRLAECLLPLFSEDKDKAIEQAQFILGEFAEKFTAAYQAGLRKKIGLFTARLEPRCSAARCRSRRQGVRRLWCFRRLRQLLGCRRWRRM
jgi:uncharacterized protein YdiU (UPF0061 family)